MKRILVTALSWDTERDIALRKALTAAKNKYQNIIITVGYSAVSLKIAATCTDVGLDVQMIAPDIEVVGAEHLETFNGITVISTTRAQYENAMTKDSAFGVTGVVAFDEGDKIALRAMSNGVKVWFPLTGKIV